MSDSDRISEEVQFRLVRLFGADVSLPGKIKKSIPVKTPCLVCGRQCRAALRIHPSCQIKVGVRKAEELRVAYFKNYEPRL